MHKYHQQIYDGSTPNFTLVLFQIKELRSPDPGSKNPNFKANKHKTPKHPKQKIENICKHV